MKILLLLISMMLISSLLLISNVSAKSTAGSSTYPQAKSSSMTLREDLPSYVFEYDLERLYPSTWEFYKKLDIINRDKVYAYYLYHPAIKDVRHKVFTLALGKSKGKTTPAPASIGHVIVSNINMKSEGLALSSRIHGITNSPAISTINFNTDSHQTVYSFLKDN